VGPPKKARFFTPLTKKTQRDADIGEPLSTASKIRPGFPPIIWQKKDISAFFCLKVGGLSL